MSHQPVTEQIRRHLIGLRMPRALEAFVQGFTPGWALDRGAPDAMVFAIWAKLDGDIRGAWYVLAQTNSPKVNARVAAEAEASRTFCVRADDATGGTAWTPTTMNADGVTVGVLGSRDPVRSRGVRDALLASVRSALAQETP